MTDAWVLRLKDESKDSDMTGDYYFLDNDESNWLTNELQNATIYEDKDREIKYMKEHERSIIEKFGEDSIINYGYTNMMKNFEFVEVEIEEI